MLVDGTIHSAAGSGLLDECVLTQYLEVAMAHLLQIGRTLGGCATGDAKLTKGHELPAYAIP